MPFLVLYFVEGRRNEKNYDPFGSNRALGFSPHSFNTHDFLGPLFVSPSLTAHPSRHSRHGICHDSSLHVLLRTRVDQMHGKLGQIPRLAIPAALFGYDRSGIRGDDFCSANLSSVLLTSWVKHAGISVPHLNHFLRISMYILLTQLRRVYFQCYSHYNCAECLESL